MTTIVPKQRPTQFTPSEAIAHLLGVYVEFADFDGLGSTAKHRIGAVSSLSRDDRARTLQAWFVLREMLTGGSLRLPDNEAIERAVAKKMADYRARKIKKATGGEQ